MRRKTEYRSNTNNTKRTTNKQNKNKKETKWEEKQLYRHFKRQTSDISVEKTWTWIKNGNLNRETESLLNAAQNNVIRTIYVKARIDKTQQDNRCRLCVDRDETIDYIICECSKFVQKNYKTKLDRIRKGIYLELCKKLKCDSTNKWYMHNPESLLDA